MSFFLKENENAFTFTFREEKVSFKGWVGGRILSLSFLPFLTLFFCTLNISVSERFLDIQFLFLKYIVTYLKSNIIVIYLFFHIIFEQYNVDAESSVPKQICKLKIPRRSQSMAV